MPEVWNSYCPQSYILTIILLKMSARTLVKHIPAKEIALCSFSCLSTASSANTTAAEARRIVIRTLQLLRPIAKQHWWAYGVTVLLSDALRAYSLGPLYMGDFWEAIDMASEKTMVVFMKYD